MLADGDRVLVAVSGGLDSLVLAEVLVFWRSRAPIDFHLQAMHVDMAPQGGGPGPQAVQLSQILAGIGLEVKVLPADWQIPDAAENTGGICYQCARNRRRLLFSYAREHGFTKLALGHHMDDLLETFLLNLTCSGNLSTMLPRQELFSGRLAIIRPLSYLEKAHVDAVAMALGREAVDSPCPMDEQTRRHDMRELATLIYQRIPGAKSNMFAALGNVRAEYLLKPAQQRSGAAVG